MEMCGKNVIDVRQKCGGRNVGDELQKCVRCKAEMWWSKCGR